MDGEVDIVKILTKTEEKKDTGETQVTTAHLEGHIETPNGEICPVKMAVEAPVDGFRGLFTPESEFKIQLYDRNTSLKDFIKPGEDAKK